MTVQEEVRQRIEQDPELIRIRKKIESGKGTYADTAAYSIRAGKLLGEVFSRRLPDIPLEEREPLCVELLHDRYIDINAAVDTAQRFMDEALGIHIAPQHAPFDSERGHQIGSSLRDLSKPVETLQRRAKAATETATKAMHDDRMESEAKFRHRAGLDCRITRVAVNGCCEWCSKVAGRYAYGEEPDDIYRRHDNCDCTVTFENGRKRQDVWSKREWEAPELGAGAGNPVVLTAEQAKALQAEKQLKVLTNYAKNGTIILRDDGEFWHPITNQSIQSIPQITAFSSVEINATVQTQCKVLLSYLIQDDIGTEGTVSIRLRDLKSEKAKGMNGEGGVLPIRLNEPYISIHNHPSDETFSAKDLRLLCTSSHCKAIIAVGNSGKNVYIIKKTESFDSDGLFVYIADKVEGKITFDTQSEFLKGAEKYGIQYYE